MKYLYRTEQASNHWLKVCKKESYRFYKNSLSLLRAKSVDIISAIINCIGSNEIDLISLGSGNGEKDNILIREFIKRLKDEEFIYYYPVDISDTLMEEAVKNSTGRGINKNRIKTKALLADFNQLLELQKVYEERPANNVFSVLGNTIGNSDEADLISSIADSMLSSDVVMMEINIGDIDINDPILREPDNLHHDFSPLASLGIPFDEKKMIYTRLSGKSIIDGTESVLATYAEAVIDGDVINGVKLSIVHHYKFDQFQKKIEEKMNVETVFSVTENDVGIIIAQRK